MNRVDQTMQSSAPFLPEEPVRRLTARLFLYNLAHQSPITVVTLDQPRIRFGRGSGTLPANAMIPPEPEKIILQRCDRDIEVWGDPSISRDHARIEFGEGEWTVFDEDSTNGTWIDGVRVISCVLRDGDRIRIGNTALFHFCVVHEVVDLKR